MVYTISGGPPMNDQMLDIWLDRLMDGDQEAFEVVYSMTRTKIYGTVAAMVSRLRSSSIKAKPRKRQMSRSNEMLGKKYKK